MAFSLLSDEDEGICARAMLQLAQNLHNRLVLLSREVNDEEKSLEQRDDWIPMRLVDAYQMAHVDMADVWEYAERENDVL